ncbi:hypothetical protein [Candidatus Kuenenia stuttgartiensis]
MHNQILSLDAISIENTQYGQMYKTKGTLTGPNGKNLTVHINYLKKLFY